MKVNPIRIVLASLILATMACAGYCNAPVSENQVGITMDDGVTINNVVGAGRYTKVGVIPEPALQIIDVSTKTNTWTDPDMVTRDSQPIGVELSISYARNRDATSIVSMWRQYNSEARDDNALWTQVSRRVPGIVKAVTVKYTLNEMLGISDIISNVDPNAVIDETMIIDSVVGRARFGDDISELLAPELAEFGVNLLSLEVVNISPDPEYLNALQMKALAIVNQDVAVQETALLMEQLNQEKAQTEIDLERARRDNQVNAELAKVYDVSPAYLQLQMLQTWAETLDETDQIIFVPEGSPLSVFLNGQSTGIIPPVAAATQ